MSYPKIDTSISASLEPKKRRGATDFLSSALAALTGKMARRGTDEAPTEYRRVLSRSDIAESEPGSGELQSVTPPTPGLYDASLAALVTQRFNDGIAHRQRHHAGWMEGLAAYRGQGHHFWNDQTGTMEHWRIRDPLQPYRVWASHPIIRPRLRKLVARALASAVNWTFAPESDEPDDVDAADDLRAVFEHIEEINDWQNLKFWVERGSITFCPHAIKVIIDPKAKLQLPYWGIDAESGEAYVVKMLDAVGPEIRLLPCTSFDFTLDPRGRTSREAAWVIFENPMTLNDVRTRWPETAIYITESAAQTGPGAGGQSMVRAVTGDLPISATQSGQKTVWVREMWEKPTLLYPRGRVAWVTDAGFLLGTAEFPGDLKELPLVVLSYDEGLESPLGLTAAQVAVPAQNSYDAMISAFEERARERGKVLYRTGLGIKSDALQSGRGYEAIPLNMANQGGGIGDAVMYLQPPPLPTEAAAMLQQANADISEIIEANDVSRGAAPPGVTSGAGIRALQESDSSTATLFRQQCKAAYQHLGDIIAQLAPLVYGGISRSLAVKNDPTSGHAGSDPVQETAMLMQVLTQSGATPQQVVQWLADEEARPTEEKRVQPRSKPHIFRALSRGRAKVVADVVAVRTPEQRRSDLMTLAQGGAFNEDQLETTLMLFEEIGFQTSDRLTQRIVKMLRRRVAERQAQQPDPAKLAADQAQATAAAQIQIARARIEAETVGRAILEDLKHQNATSTAVMAGQAIDTDPIVAQELAPRLDATAEGVQSAFQALEQGNPDAEMQNAPQDGSAAPAGLNVPSEVASADVPENTGGEG
jgi:hypothetical protein